MTQAEFENMIKAYGVNPLCWPAAQAPLAHAFIAKFPEQSEKLMSADAKLDDVLDLMTAPAPSDLLKKRILNAATVKAANENAPAPRSGLLHWRHAAALMVATFALGFGGANFLTSSETSTGTLYAETDTIWEDTADELGLLDTYTWVEEDANL